MNDHIVARLGKALGAPVGEPQIIEIPHELIEIEQVSLSGKRVEAMGSSYSIIQYVPNPISEERINIGVMAFDDEAVKVKFLTRWDRVSCFASMADLPSLKEFASEMEKVTRQGLLFPGDVLNQTPNHERLINVVHGWANSIQFTEPRRSLETVDDLLADIQETYLIEPTPPTHLG